MREIYFTERESDVGTLRYYLLERELDEAEGMAACVYGVAVRGPEESASVPSVTMSQTAALELVKRMADGTVLPSELKYIVEDWAAGGT